MLATKEVPNGTAVERQDPCKMDRETDGRCKTGYRQRWNSWQPAT